MEELEQQEVCDNLVVAAEKEESLLPHPAGESAATRDEESKMMDQASAASASKPFRSRTSRKRVAAQSVHELDRVENHQLQQVPSLQSENADLQVKLRRAEEERDILQAKLTAMMQHQAASAVSAPMNPEEIKQIESE
jgi:hypothetical protein